MYRRCGSLIVHATGMPRGNIVVQTLLLSVNSGCLFSVFVDCLSATCWCWNPHWTFRNIFRSLAFQVPEMTGQATHSSHVSERFGNGHNSLTWTLTNIHRVPSFTHYNSCVLQTRLHGQMLLCLEECKVFAGATPKGQATAIPHYHHPISLCVVQVQRFGC